MRLDLRSKVNNMDFDRSKNETKLRSSNNNHARHAVVLMALLFIFLFQVQTGLDWVNNQVYKIGLFGFNKLNLKALQSFVVFCMTFSNKSTGTRGIMYSNKVFIINVFIFHNVS